MNHLFAPVGLLSVFISFTQLASDLWAQSVTTQPVGAVNLTIPAGTGTTRSFALLSFPLFDSESPEVVSRGIVNSVTSSTVSVAQSTWQAGQLSQAAAPYMIVFTSGEAKGRSFLISTSVANTETTITIDSEEASLVDLTTLGITTGSSGDKFVILPCDTLSSLFGTPASTGVLGGSSPTSADMVQVLVQGAWRQYYYNTVQNAWLRVGPNTNSNNVPLRRDAAVWYGRLSTTPLQLILTGNVPTQERRPIVRNSGLTSLSNPWPLDTTLSALAINTLPGWVSSTNPAVADVVQILVSGPWRQYYHNGSQWLRVGPNTPSNNQAIGAGSGVVITKRGLTAGSSTFVQNMPYSL